MMPKAIADKLTKVIEALFKDLAENFEMTARNCRNHDASTALSEAAGAIHMMDIPYLVREALEIPHGDTTPVVPDFEVSGPLHRVSRK